MPSASREMASRILPPCRKSTGSGAVSLERVSEMLLIELVLQVRGEDPDRLRSLFEPACHVQKGIQKFRHFTRAAVPEGLQGAASPPTIRAVRCRNL